MITRRTSRFRVAPERRSAWCSFVAATLATYGSFVGVLLSLRYVAGVMPAASLGLQSSPERIVLVTPRAPSSRAEGDPVVAPEQPSALPRASRIMRRLPQDTGATGVSPASSTTTSAMSPTSALTFDATPRLARPRPDARAWIAVPGERDPFAPPTVPTAALRDSMLGALSLMVPDLAARRAPTRAEVDSAAKEATLKMRLAGRYLLVPPDNSGGLITLRVPLPGGPSKSARARTVRAHDEGQARLRRLLARADSIRRAREDSLRSATLMLVP